MASRKIEELKWPESHEKEQSGDRKKTDGEQTHELETVERLLLELETKLRGDSFKPSIADLVRLLLLRRELEEEQPKEISVQWVEPEMGSEEPTAG